MNKIKLIDGHAHIVSSIKYKNSNLDDVIKDGEQNLLYIVNVGIDEATSKEVISLNQKYKFLLPVIGIHPLSANNFKSDDIYNIEKIINKNVIAIGETGLDYYHKHNIKKQKEAFVAHINLAKKYNLPVMIHSRNSFNDVYEIIKEYDNVKFLLHSWCGDINLTKKLLVFKNIFFSFSGILTFKNAPEVKEIFKLIPENKILFETDSPWLTPEPFRGKTNYSKYVRYVIEEGAKLKNKTFEEMLIIANNNFKNFYNLNDVC